MKNKILKMLLMLLFLLSICSVCVQAETFACEEENLIKFMVSAEEAALGVREVSTRPDFWPSLADGNHEKWIDRVVLPDYAIDFYELLCEGTDNDGKNDFLIYKDSPCIEKIQIEEVSDDGNEHLVDAYAVKVGSIQGRDKDYDTAVYELNKDFNDKYYKIRTAQIAFDRDHSEIFWMNTSTYLSVPEYELRVERDAVTGKYMYIFSGELYFVLESPTYNIRSKTYLTDELIISNIAQVNKSIDDIIASANVSDDYELVRYFNQWLTTHNEHNCETIEEAKYNIATWYLPELFECTSALFCTTGDYAPECEAYARALDVLCNRVGIPCVIETGTVISDSHPEGLKSAWNMVQIDGKWYAVDAAANDIVVRENKGNPISGKESEEFLLVGLNTRVMNGNHVLWEGFDKTHFAENKIDTNGVSFLNGPVLELEQYNCTIKSISVKKRDYKNHTLLTANAILNSWSYGELTYTWYSVDEYGHETEMKGISTNTFSIVNELNGGTYTFRVKVTAGNCIKYGECSFYIKGFTDVPKTAYYYEPVLWAVDQNITAGMTRNTFAPEMECTRGQLVTFLWRFFGCPQAETQEMLFEDVEEGSYYYNAVLWGCESGIVMGYTPKSFAPEDEITRAQLAAFLWRAAGSPEYVGTQCVEFTDVIEDVWFYNAVYWAAENNITKGYSPEIFAPNATATRAEIVTFLYRAKDIFCTTQ